MSKPTEPITRTYTKGTLTVDVPSYDLFFTVYDNATGRPVGTITRPHLHTTYWTVCALDGKPLPGLVAGPVTALSALHRHLNGKA